MLGWALNKATGNAPSDAPPTPGPDDTLIEQPDTPAPVFAARAFKRALFGTPAPKRETKTKTGAKKPDKHIAKHTLPMPESTTYDSPSKPQGILLTPGTGAGRRKRVSFGREVKATNPMLPEGGDGAIRNRPKTRLQEALENSRKRRGNRSSTEDDARKLHLEPQVIDEDADNLWEEVDELDGDAEGTVDLNEPRSQSGRYWKSEFQKYHEEAQAEMEKLVKYKQLAKSYAKAKDAEAMDLAQHLKEEQTKVAEMERRITELAGQIGAKYGRLRDGQDERELLKDLTRQTALAVEYRKKVNELETCLKDSGYEADGSKRRSGGQPTARDQLKELTDLRLELQRAKAELIALEERERKADADKRDLERRLSRKNAQYDSLKAEYDELKAKNRAIREEVCTLKRASQSGDVGRLREEIKIGSTTASAPCQKSRMYGKVQLKIKNEETTRRREMEDASVTIHNLQQEFKKNADSLPAQRKLSTGLRARRGATPKLDDDTQELLQHRPISSIRRIATPLGRPTNRAIKRTVSGRVIDKKSEFPSQASVRRRTETQKTVGLARPSNKSHLGLVTERALESELDLKPNSVPRHPNTTTQAPLASDRRAAILARLEQKRAERKKAREQPIMPGKENLRL